MGHDICNRLRDYRTRAAQFFTPLYPNTMMQDHFSHNLHYMYVQTCQKEDNKNNDNYDRSWKIKEVFDNLDDVYSNFYSPSECLAIDEVIVLFRGRLHSSSLSPKKHKHFRIKIYKLCDTYGYTYDVEV
jgi:hypothetical protein